MTSMAAASGDGIYPALAAAINAQLAVTYHVGVTLVQYPSQGDFAWYYQNANQVFNQWTLGYLSARVFPGQAAGLAALSSPGGLPDAYAELLAGMTYQLSSADQARHDPALLQQQAAGTLLLQQLRQQTAQPTMTNGGILTLDPVDGAVSTAYQVGFGVTMSLAAIQSSLGDPGRTMTVTIPCSPGSQGATTTLSYPGCTMVPVSAASWQQATAQGWFDPDPIAQAFLNGTRDVTGYHFASAPAFAPGPVGEGGTFGWLTGLLVSGYPTVTVCVDRGLGLATADTLETTIGDVLESLRLVGLGSSSSIPYAVRPASAPTGAASPPVTGAPRVLAVEAYPAPGPSVPQLQQTAYVVGAVLGFAPAPGSPGSPD